MDPQELEDYEPQLAMLPNAGAEPPPESPLGVPAVAVNPAQFAQNTEAIDAAKKERDRRVALADTLQGVTDIGASLASQGRVHADPAAFEAARKSAEKGVEEAIKERETNRKAMSDYIIQKRLAEQQGQRLAHQKSVADATQDWRKTVKDNRDRQFRNKIDQEITDDPSVKPMEQNLIELNRNSGFLKDPTVPVTPQRLAEAQQAVASALVIRGGAATEGRVSRTAVDTTGLEVARFLQKYANQPGIDLRKIQPKLVETVQNQIDSMRNGYVPDINARKLQLIQNKKRVNKRDPEYLDFLNDYEHDLKAEAPKETAPGPQKEGEVGPSGLTPEERRKRIEFLRSKLGQENAAQ